MLKKRLFSYHNDLENFINTKKNEFNSINKIYYDERFFIYPSVIGINNYYKRKYSNITNKIVSFSTDQIEHYGCFKRRSILELEIQKVFSFSFAIDNTMTETYLRIKQIKEKNDLLKDQIEKYQRSIDQANSESFSLEHRKAVRIISSFH